MSEITDEHRAAAAALTRLTSRKAELDAEEQGLDAEVRKAEQALVEARKRAQARRDEISGERVALEKNLAAAKRADARLRELAPKDLRVAQGKAQEALDAAAKVLRGANEALELAQVGGDQALVESMRAKVAAAEATHAKAADAYQSARAALDAAHDEVRARLTRNTPKEN